MPMKPNKGESQSEFMSRCVPDLMGDGKREQDQAVAACMSIWREREKNVKWYPEPEQDEQEEDFIDRCVEELVDEEEFDEDNAQQICQVQWEDNQPYEFEAAPREPRERREPRGSHVQHKTHAGAVNGMAFTLSDESPDRMGDVILSAGWQLDNFRRNPIALFNHLASFPIGKWTDLRVEKGALRGHLELAPAGTSDRIDEIRKLIDCGILKAVSVGFRPIDSQPRKSTEGQYLGETFTKQELVETSLVSVPANPNALAIAKSLKISADTLDLVFAEHGNKDGMRRRGGATGKHAETSRNRRGTAMSPLAQRIKDAHERIVVLRDKLTEHLKSVDDSNVTDDQLEITQELNAKIAQEEKGLAALKEAERNLAASVQKDDRAVAIHTTTAVADRTTSARPFNVQPKKVDPVEYVVRAGTIAMIAHLSKRSIDDVRLAIAQHYPWYGDDATKAYVEYVQRAATAPAMTSVAGWAAELVQTVYANFMETLMPKSVFPRLASMGLTLSFGRAGKISIPTRSRTPTIAGSFVGEGQPIPVRQGAFTAQVLVPKKMAVITVWTREIDEHSVPAIEGLLRQAIQEDTAVSLDSVLIDANAATAVRPAGLLNGVAALTATSGGGFPALVGDIKQLTGALITSTSGHIRSPAWLMNPQQLNSAGLIPAPNSGVFPFRDELARGSLQGYPVIDSGTVPLGTVVLVDAADFVVVGGDAPRFEVSDQATLHLDDTTPLPITSPGTPATVAAPVQSLWQTDSLALRLILPVNWALRRTGVVAWTQNVTW